MITQFSKKKGHFCEGGGCFFLRLLKHMVLEQPTVDIGGVSRGRSVAMAVGFWHFNGTSIELQLHLNATLTELHWHFNGTKTAKKYIIFLGCGQCDDIFFYILKKKKVNKDKGVWQCE